MAVMWCKLNVCFSSRSRNCFFFFRLTFFLLCFAVNKTIKMIKRDPPVKLIHNKSKHNRNMFHICMSTTVNDDEYDDDDDEVHEIEHNLTYREQGEWNKRVHERQCKIVFAII